MDYASVVRVNGNFVGVIDAAPHKQPQIIVVLNWFEELKRLVPMK